MPIALFALQDTKPQIWYASATTPAISSDDPSDDVSTENQDNYTDVDQWHMVNMSSHDRMFPPAPTSQSCLQFEYGTSFSVSELAWSYLRGPSLPRIAEYGGVFPAQNRNDATRPPCHGLNTRHQLDHSTISQLNHSMRCYWFSVRHLQSPIQA